MEKIIFICLFIISSCSLDRNYQLKDNKEFTDDYIKEQSEITNLTDSEIEIISNLPSFDDEKEEIINKKESNYGTISPLDIETLIKLKE